MKRFLRVLLFIVLFSSGCLGFPGSSSSQEVQVWTNLGLYGGQIYDIAIDPSSPDKMFAGSYMGDGLFVTENGGMSWQAVETDNNPPGEGSFKSHAVYAVKIAPSNNNVIWAAHNYWVEKSTDGGLTWTHILNSTMQRNCQNCEVEDDNFRLCKCIAIDPDNSDIVYVGTGGPHGTYSSGAIYKTEDGGQTWTKTNQGADFDYLIEDIAIDPQDSNVIWAVTSSWGYGAYAGTLYRSEDQGQTWSTIFTTSGTFYDVEVKPNDSNSIFTANAWGIYRHYFEEGEWKYEWLLNYLGDWPPPSDEVFARMVRALAFDPQNPDILYAAWENPYGGDPRPKVAKGTPPYGDSDWEIHTGDYNFLTLAVHPMNSQVIFGGEGNLGIYKSQDQGITWTPVNEGINAFIVYDIAIDPNDSDHKLAGTLSGLFEKKGADPWSRILTTATKSLRFHPSDSHIFYAGLWYFLAKTIDGGLTWSYSDDLGYLDIHDIAIDPVNTDTLFIASNVWDGQPGDIQKSTDGGKTFETVLEGVNPSGEAYDFNAVAIDPSDPNHIFAGGGNFYTPRVLGSLWESKNGGSDWTRTGLRDVIVNDILIDPQDPDVMYAGCGYSGGTDVPVYKSSDQGATWTPSHEGIPSRVKYLLRDVWASSSTDLIAVGDGISILRYDGTTWTDMDTQDELSGVWGSAQDSVFAVGNNGRILYHDGSNWTEMNSGTTEFLRVVWGNSGTNVFAVGDNGTILRYNGSTWTTVNSGTTKNLFGVWGSSRTDVFAVGSNGTILHYNGMFWAAMDSGTTKNLFGVWGSSRTDVFAVGNDGTILHYNGFTWSAMTSGTTNDLRDVWGSSGTDVFAVGGDGIILHYDGSTWSEMTVDANKNLLGIWGTSSEDVFVVGGTGGIYQYDGSTWSVMKEPGKNQNSVTDLEFQRQNTHVVYAATFETGVYVSPNQAGNWLNLGTPEYSVFAISTSSLYAATQGGLLQCTGTGVIAGNVIDAPTGSGIDGASVYTDLGDECTSVAGEYMIVCPSGIFDVTAIADNHNNETMEDMTVLGGDVTWTNFNLQRAFSGGGGGGSVPDTDEDGTPDRNDGCPLDPLKIEPGICGCGVPDTDTDEDGTTDCNDACPEDPNKITPGICGCSIPDTDTDEDGTPDCNDGCPDDPNKTTPGVCGCGIPDTDSDSDGIPDCIDDWPSGPKVTQVTGDDRANAVVTLGSVVTGGDQMALVMNFPAYEAAVDIYAAVQFPDGNLYVVKSDGSLTMDFVPYATGVTQAQSATLLDSFDVCTPSGAFVPTGTWQVYAVVTPTNGGNFSAIDFTSGEYDLWFYSFDVTCP